MPVADDIVVKFDACVVSIDVSLLLGLNVLQKMKLIVEFRNDKLINKYRNWHAKLVRKIGHLYVEWPPSIYYTEAEMQRNHLHFYHPSTEKLVGLINHGAKEHTTARCVRQLKHVQASCDICLKLAASPNCFKDSVANEDCVFNPTVGMDIKDGKTGSGL